MTVKLRSVVVASGLGTALLALSGCATAIPIAPGVATAQMTFSATGGAATLFYAPENLICEKLSDRLIAQEGLLWDNTTKPVSVPAGARIYIRSSVTAPAGYRSMVECDNLVSIIPQAGHTYSVAQTLESNSCHTDIWDAADNRPPASFERHPVPTTLCSRMKTPPAS